MSENDTTIPLTAGITLWIDRDRILSPVDDAQVRRARMLFDRATQLEELQFVVDHLVTNAGDRAERHLDRILEPLGWNCKMRSVDTAEVAAAIVALAGAVDEGRLANTLEVAKMEMHKWWGRREEIAARDVRAATAAIAPGPDPVAQGDQPRAPAASGEDPARDRRHGGEVRAVVSVEHVDDPGLGRRILHWIDQLIATHGGS
jgi:hypothetical protein